jgi:hypothetical protein
MGSGRAGLPRRTLQPTAVALPPGLIARRQVIVAFPPPARAVDEVEWQGGRVYLHLGARRDDPPRR